VSASIKDIDKGYKKLMSRVSEAVNTPGFLTVGLHEAEGERAHQTHTNSKGEEVEEVTMLDVGLFHEFGTIDIPRRSFIADWADENKSNHEEQLRKMAKAVIAGKVPNFETAFHRLGSLYVGEIQKRIADGIAPALAQSTIDRKGSSVPLIDTGQLRSSIRYRIGHSTSSEGGMDAMAGSGDASGDIGGSGGGEE
jgi:hypothetical protein